MYKTGDQAYWTERGTVVFLGRVDEQISIRGFRIEPGEIETILVEQPNIAEALVVVHPTAGGKLSTFPHLTAQRLPRSCPPALRS